MGVITDKQLNQKPTDTDQWLIEDGPRGAGRFVARITPKGERVFYYRYTDTAGQRVRLPIGSYRSASAVGLTLKEARQRAAGLADLYQSGHRDLRGHLARQQADAKQAAESQRREAAEAKRQAEQERARRLTVRQLFERWACVELTPHVRPDGTRLGRKDAGASARAHFERRVFPKLGELPAADLRKIDLLDILDATRAESKLRTCNVLLTEMKQMLRFAVAREIIPHNPLETVSKRDAGGAEIERERVLRDDEISALVKQLPAANMGLRSQHAVWLILSTACRVGELMNARWDDVNMAAGTWHLPETKNQRPHTIHLSDFAMKHFGALAELRETDAMGRPVPWVFPNTARTGPVNIKSFGKQLADRQRNESRRLAGRSKATGSLMLTGGRWTAHDLRRTAATLMARLGLSTDVIDECLNHILPSRVARIYIRDRREAEQVRAFNLLGVHLQALAEPTEAQSATVHVLRPAA